MRTRSIQLFITIGSILFSSYFSLAQQSAISLSPAAQAAQQKLASLIEEKGIPGISMTIIQGDKEENMVAGMADLEKQVPLAPHHRMLSGSIGKTYFAAQALLLVDQGKLDLDEKAIHYLKGEQWFLQVPNAKEITIRSLLNHTSGVPEYVYSPGLWKGVAEAPDKQWTAAERLGFISGQDAHFQVGKGWSYADANYIILGAVVEKVTGEDIYEMVQRNILDPLGLEQTEPSVQPEMKNLTAAYTGRNFAETFGEKVSELGKYGLNPQFEWTGGGFVTNSSDLAKWIKHLYAGKVIDQKCLDQMAAPVNRTTGIPAKTGYGFGAEIFATGYGLAYGHSGFMLGFLSLTAYMPDYDMSIALQINADPYSTKMKGRITVFEIMETILPFFIKKNKGYPNKTKVYLVRHAEKENDGTRNPDLSPAGKKRADHLAEVLANSGVTTIYSTPFKRTKDTGSPLAKKINQEIQSYMPTSGMVVYDIVANHPGETILIVGHSNTVPTMVNMLAKKAGLKQLDESQYGDLFRVDFKKGKGKLKRSTF